MVEKIGVNVRNVIRLLGDNLYGTPDVVVRELLQNCRDAIYERFGPDGESKGRIDITVGTGVLQFSDNGNGMDREGLREHLSKLGTGIKRAHQDWERTKEETHKKTTFIGEYGIGFFSAFMISDQITVRTQHPSAQNSFVWTSSGLEDYEIEDGAVLDEPGTHITLRLQRALTQFGDESYIRSVVKQYCNYLDCKIFMGTGQVVNAGRFVWELERDADRLSWLTERLEDRPRHFTYGRRQRGTKTLFEYALACRYSTSRHHEIFSKRMFVTDSLEIFEKPLDILDVIINCDDLKLTLSREEIVTGTLFREIQGELRTIGFEWIAKLVKTRRGDQELEKIIKANQALFRQLALEDPKLFQDLFALIFFVLAGTQLTSSVPEYISNSPEDLKASTVLYVRKGAGGDQDRERLLLLICEERKIPVFAIDSDEDEELLRRICTKCNARKAHLSTFDKLITSDAGKGPSEIEAVRSNCERFLGMKTSLSSFDPPELPLVVQGSEIVLNRQNTFLSNLSLLRARPDRQRLVYNSLLKIIKSLNQVGADKMRLRELLRQMTDSLTDWSRSLDDLELAEKELKQLKVGWWSGVPSLAQLQTQARPFVMSGRDYLFRCFIVISFHPVYRDVINVVIEECAKHGIWAQTAGEIDNREILTKICLFIEDADFAIVDISESNPNVLLELGIILARRKPAIILRSTSMATAKGVTVPADIVGIERIEYSNATEDLRTKISLVCRRIVGEANAQKSKPKAE